MRYDLAIFTIKRYITDANRKGIFAPYHVKLDDGDDLIDMQFNSLEDAKRILKRLFKDGKQML